MKKEKTIEEKINEAVEALKSAMVENIQIDQLLLDVKQRKEKARYNLIQAKDMVRAMEAECMNN